MDKVTLVIIVILILALLFFGITLISSNNSANTGRVSSSYPSSQYVGGGCGR